MRHSIRRKLLAMLLFFISSMFLLGLFSMSNISDSYIQHAYEMQTASLNASIYMIEEKLSVIESETYDLISSDIVQNAITQLLEYMEQLKTGELTATQRGTRTVAVRAIQRAVSDALYENELFDASYYISPDGALYKTSARNQISLTDEQLQKLTQECEEKRECCFCVLEDARNYLFAVRNLYERKGLSLRYAGTAVFCINLPKMMTYFSEGTVPDLIMRIQNSDGELIYESKGEQNGSNTLTMDMLGDGGYAVADYGNTRSFITGVSSKVLDWEYYGIADYNAMFGTVLRMTKIYELLFVILSALLLLIGAWFGTNLAQPIEKLTKHMRAIRHDNDLQVSALPLLPDDGKNRMDEIGELDRQFNKLISEINRLINENYKNQILVQEAQIATLQAQINPHFLYNTLDMIRWLATEKQYQQIPRIVSSLSLLLRSAMSTKKAKIKLSEELDNVRAYIMIQRARFRDRLKLTIVVPEQCFDYLVPVMSLQMLVENSVTHALEQMLEPCCINVSAMFENESLRLCVEDNGPGIDPHIIENLHSGKVKASGNGIGLSNLDERMRRMYDKNGKMLVENAAEHGAKITLVLPLEGIINEAL
ncbi:MAG: histidine kinase [Ruminococcaceae bacterium]|nr:histidine kinase [Oscillospiraceae bacterium]